MIEPKDGISDEEYDEYSRTGELRQYVKTLEKLNEGYEDLMTEIPECPVHGKCLSHAREWIREVRSIIG